jgi:hypothetical protein
MQEWSCRARDDALYLCKTPILVRFLVRWFSITSLTLKIETVCFSKMLASIYVSTGCQNLEQHPYYHKNRLTDVLGFGDNTFFL